MVVVHYYDLVTQTGYALGTRHNRNAVKVLKAHTAGWHLPIHAHSHFSLSGPLQATNVLFFCF